MELDQNRSGAAELLNLTGGRPQQQVDQDLIVSSSWSLLSSVQDHRLCGSVFSGSALVTGTESRFVVRSHGAEPAELPESGRSSVTRTSPSFCGLINLSKLESPKSRPGLGPPVFSLEVRGHQVAGCLAALWLHALPKSAGQWGGRLNLDSLL